MSEQRQTTAPEFTDWVRSIFKNDDEAYWVVEQFRDAPLPAVSEVEPKLERAIELRGFNSPLATRVRARYFTHKGRDR